MTRVHNPPHPGQTLREDALAALWLTVTEVAIQFGVDVMTIARESIRKTDFRGIATGKRLAPIHPGEVLLKEFIEPMGLTCYQVAKAIKVQQRRIDEICAGKRSVTAATALRFAKLFGMDAQTWMSLQVQYDLEIAERELSKQIDREVVPLPQAA